MPRARFLRVWDLFYGSLCAVACDELVEAGLLCAPLCPLWLASFFESGIKPLIPHKLRAIIVGERMSEKASPFKNMGLWDL